MAERREGGSSYSGLLHTWKFESTISQRQSEKVCPTGEDCELGRYGPISGQHHVTPRSHHFCMESRTHLKALLLEVLTVSGRFEAFTQKAGTGAGKSQYLSEVGGHVCQAVYATCHKADSLHQGYTLGIKGPAACCPESILASRDNADEEPGILKPNGFVTNSTIVYSTML